MGNTAVREIAYSGLSYTVHLGRGEYAFNKVTYEDELSGVELLTMIGSQQASARTRGIYSPKPATVSQLRSEWNRMMLKFPSNGFGNFKFPITVTGSDPDLPKFTDRLLLCTILGQKCDIEGTGKASMIEFKVQPQQIVWNGRTINLRRGAPQRNPSGSQAPGTSIGSLLKTTFEL